MISLGITIVNKVHGQVLKKKASVTEQNSYPQLNHRPLLLLVLFWDTVNCFLR